MNYVEYKQLEKEVIDSGNLNAISVLTEQLMPHINQRIQSYAYTHSDLTSEEYIKLLQLLDLPENTILIGGEVHQVTGGMLRKTDEIDLFKVLSLIDFIIKARILI